MITVAFYSAGTSYEREADLLRASLDRVGMRHDIRSYPDRGSWDANTAQKAALIRDARERHAGPLLYVDVDAFVHEDCTEYFERLAARGIDFACHWFAGPSGGHNQRDVCACVRGEKCNRQHRLLSGTLYFGDTDGARRLLQVWEGWNRVAEAGGVLSGGGQRNLWALVTSHRDDFRMQGLPGRYTYVFDKPWGYPPNEPCIIEHTIASRDNRAPGAKGDRGRRNRIAELQKIVKEKAA